MKSVLIVDDSATMRRMVIASLRRLNKVKFDEASSGLEAIERMALGKVDLMVLDLNMPDIHGLEVLKFVRNHPKLQATPIIVLTTRGDEASRSEAMTRGASLYLTKPFDPHVLAREAQQLMDVNP
jgi:two-component system chemotaxis response regulator CheY